MGQHTGWSDERREAKERGVSRAEAVRLMRKEALERYEGARMSLEAALIDAEQYRPDDPQNEGS